jgi:thymidylate synthase ThyX
VNHRRISQLVLGGAKEGQGGATPLSLLLSTPIRRVFIAARIQSFCFESKRYARQRASCLRFDSKQNVESDDVCQRFDSKQKAALDYRRSFSQQVMNAQARSWPHCAQHKGEMLMLS